MEQETVLVDGNRAIRGEFKALRLQVWVPDMGPLAFYGDARDM